MGLFKRRDQIIDPNIELGKFVIKSKFLDQGSLSHLAAIIRASGAAGVFFRTDWPSEQQIAVHESSNDLAERLLSKLSGRTGVSTRDCLIEFEQTIDELTKKLALDDFEPHYQAPLIFAVSELICRKQSILSKDQLTDSVETVLTIIVGIKWFPKWSVENSDFLNDRLSFANHGALSIHRDAIYKVVLENEFAFNAGVSYMLGQGNKGDGTLIVTNTRLIFVFDNDLRKSTQSFLLSNITGFSFSETSVVPMSKELTIQFNDFGFSRSISFYVGNSYSVELTNLFLTNRFFR